MQVGIRDHSTGVGGKVVTTLNLLHVCRVGWLECGRKKGAELVKHINGICEVAECWRNREKL